MHCTLLIPGLFWPRETADAMFSGLELRALGKLLARARAQRFDPIATEAWLCQAFEIERQQDWPIAPLTLALDGGEAGDTYWLRADPVHIKIERDGLRLMESALFEVTPAEAQALAGALDEYFAGNGLAFHAPHPKRWYVSVGRTPKLATHAISEAAGRNVEPLLPHGEDEMRWHRVFNEAQMLLHNHPVNTSREERGEPIVNSVWFWGGGMWPAVPGRAFAAVWSDDATAVAIAAASGTDTESMPADAESWLEVAVRRGGNEAHLVVLDDLGSPAAYADAALWRSRLSALEAHWFAPLEQALRESRLRGLALVAPGPTACWRFDLARADLRRFWRRARPWTEFA